MKNLLFIIILLCISIASFAQSYDYNKVVTISRGSDFFSFDNKQTHNISGKIIIKNDIVQIGESKYRLVKQIAANTYKTRGGTVAYIYAGHQLRTVHVHRYHTDYYYSIFYDNNQLTANL